MRLFSMSVQERDYLQDRPLHDVPAIQLDHADIAAKSVADEKRSIEMDAAKKQLAAEKKRVKQLLAKIEDMHTAAMTRPEVIGMVMAIERSLVALCEVRTNDERSRQIMCGVHRLLQAARVEQGAAGELPAARIGWEAALAAYYADCSPRELEVVERFDSEA